MIRVSATLNRKVPLPGVQYGSQGFGGSIEVELSDTATPDQVRNRLHELYQTLNAAVDAEIAAVRPGSSGHTQGQPPKPLARPNCNGRHPKAANGNGRHVPATQAQVRAIHAICQDQGLNPTDVIVGYGVGAPEGLSVKDASKLIDQLKEMKAGQ